MLFFCGNKRNDFFQNNILKETKFDLYLFEASVHKGFDLSNNNKVIVASVKASLKRNRNVLIIKSSNVDYTKKRSHFKGQHYFVDENLVFLSPSIQKRIREVDYLQVINFNDFRDAFVKNFPKSQANQSGKFLKK